MTNVVGIVIGLALGGLIGYICGRIRQEEINE